VLIKARLKGHEFDLLTLAELFRPGDPAVATDDERRADVLTAFLSLDCGLICARQPRLL
jgi:hypothetical protein